MHLTTCCISVKRRMVSELYPICSGEGGQQHNITFQTFIYVTLCPIRWVSDYSQLGVYYQWNNTQYIRYSRCVSRLTLSTSVLFESLTPNPREQASVGPVSLSAGNTIATRVSAPATSYVTDSSSSSSLFPNWHIHVQHTKMLLYAINNMYIQFEVAPKGRACDGGATLAIISQIYATGWYTIDIKYNNMVKKTSLKSCGVTASDPFQPDNYHWWESGPALQI